MPSSSDEVATRPRICPAFRLILDLDALRPRERAVVRADQHLAGELVQRRGQPLGDAPAVDEDQRRGVRPHQLEQPRMDRRPDRACAPAPARPRPLGISSGWPIFAMSSTGTSMRQLELLLLRGVDDRDRPVTPAPPALGRELVVDRIVGIGGWRRAGRRCGLVAWRRPAGCRRLRARACRQGSARPRRAGAASPTGRCAAPARAFASRSRSSRSSDSARCAPRLVGTSAWISSMMTVSTDRSASRALEVSSR